MQFSVNELKPYTIEVYGPGDAEALLWKRDNDRPFTPMARGDRLVLPEAPDARRDRAYRIQDVEHLIWTRGDNVRFVTRLHVALDESGA